jgi:threonine dehydrogenase-like Zn-dependent dehydrogenase
MKAAVIERPGRLVIKDVPRPVCGENEIVIKVRSASICNSTDHHIYEGTFTGYHDYYPQIFAHEVCGDVVETGRQVKGLRDGERIVFYTGNGAFCEYTKVNADWPWARVADSISDEEAPLIEMFYGALIQSVFPAPMKDGEKVLIIGQGPMGLTTLQSVKAMNRVLVGAIDMFDFRLQKSKGSGADFTYNRSNLSSDEIAEQITKDMGKIDLIHVCTSVDMSKEQDLFDFAVKVCSEFGRITGLNVEVKGLQHSVRVFPLFRKNILMARSLDLEAYPLVQPEMGIKQREVFQMGADWMQAGKVNLKSLITHQITMEEAAKGIHLCHAEMDKTIKVVMKMG